MNNPTIAAEGYSSQSVTKEISNYDGQIAALRKDISEKTNRAESARAKLADNLTVSAEFNAIRQAALADGNSEKLKKADEKLSALTKENNLLKDIIAACETVVSEKRELLQEDMKYRARLENTLADAQLTEMLPEINDATRKYAAIVAEAMRLASIAGGWAVSGFRETIPEDLYVYTVNEPSFKIWSKTHGLISEIPNVTQ